MRSFVESGLKDLSVSRTSIKWGIPFPGRPGHVVYVWLDALVNYITALGFGSTDASLYERYWPGIHVIGKDILRFHAVYWPAFLMSAGLGVPRQVVSHGWWLRDAKKMSKSTGNVVRPDDLVAAFGVDALRWHLVAAMSFGQDASFSDEDFLSGYNADLANGLGNTLSRAVKMSRDFFDGKTPPKTSTKKNSFEWPETAAASVSRWRAAFEGYRLQDAAGEIRALLGAIDSYITTNEPWRARPDDSFEELSGFPFPRPLSTASKRCALRPCMLAPIAPRTATEIFRRLGIDKRAEDSAPVRSRVGPAPPERPAPVRAAAFSEGGRERIFCFQRRIHGQRLQGEICGRDRKRRFLRRVCLRQVPRGRRGCGAPPAPSPAAGGSTGALTAPEAIPSSPSKQNPPSPSTLPQQATTPRRPPPPKAKSPSPTS